MTRNFYLIPALFMTLHSAKVSGQCGGTLSVNFPTSVCLGTKPLFYFNTTGATVNTYTLDFGDGSDSVVNSKNRDSIDHTYATAGKYYLTLIRKIGGCRDTLTDSIQVLPRPSPGFTMAYDSVCSAQRDTFTANTSGYSSYIWTYSTGGGGSGLSATRTFTNAGSSPTSTIVKLVVTHTNGCKDSSQKTVIIMPLPNPGFTFTGDSACSYTNIPFTNSSTGATTYKWNFKGGGTSTATSPTHSFSYSGNGYTRDSVELIAYTSFGCADSITKAIYIKQRPDGSVADYNNSPAYTFCNSGNFSLQIDDSSTTASTDSTHWFYWGDSQYDSIINFNGNNISHTYTSKGFFTLQVKTIGKNKCIQNKYYTIFNGGNPSVGLANPGGTTGLCGPAVLKFPLTSFNGNPSGTVYTVSSNDGSSSLTYTHPPPDTIVWTFNNSSCGYTSQGGFSNSFHIKITAVNPCGSSQATVEPITLNKSPKADFTISPSNVVCKDDIVSFTDNSTPGNVIPSGGGSCSNVYKRIWQVSPTSNWDSVSGTKLGAQTQWFNNNPSTSGSSTLQLKLKDTGIFYIKLIVANPSLTCGSDTMIKPVKVVNPPIAKFKFSADSGCINLTDTFKNQTTGENVTYKWTITPSSGFTYKNSTSDTSTHPILEFTSSGTYIVKLEATNPCSTSVYIDTLIVKKKPTVTFPSISNGCQSYSINPSATFNKNLSTITNYSWKFPGGSPSTSSSQSPGTVVYNSAGTYSITVYATNECGTDSAQQSFTVYSPPNINIGKSADTVCQGSSSYNISGYTPTGGTWSGTGVSSGGTFNPSTSGTGTFTLTYIYTDGNGCKDTATKKILVLEKPVAKFVFTDRCLDSAIQFTDSSTTSSGTITSRSWSFGDGNTSATTHPSHTYSNAGNYNVKLVIKNTAGCTDSIIKSVNVYPKPVISFSVNDSVQCLQGNSFAFTNNTSVSSGSISSYKWTFGDTSSSVTTTSPSHSYADTGSYTVMLRAVTNRGCRDSASRIMKVLLGPSVSFTINDTAQCSSGHSFVFSSTSAANGGTITGISWTFGNGNTSTNSNPSAQTYSSSGTYAVKLIITNSKGCKDSLTKNIQVLPQPSPNYTTTDSVYCAPDSVYLTNNTSSTPVITSWKWIISGISNYILSSDTAKNPVLILPDNTSGYDSTIYIKLKGTTSEGCSDSSTLKIRLLTRPVTSFNIHADSCGPVNFSPVNNSLYASVYTWSSNPSVGFSNINANSPVISIPNNTSASNKKYIIKLITATSRGCMDSLWDTITVYNDPKAQFNVSNTDSCSPLKVKFTNTTTPGGGTTYSWDFGNGVTTTQKDTSIEYIYNGVSDSLFQVKLIAKTSQGCLDDTIRGINLRPNAKASYSYTNSSGCAPFVLDTSVLKTQVYTGANNTYTWFADNAQIGTGSTFPGYTISSANDSVIIKLRVTSLRGCKNDSLSVQFKTIDNPVPAFTVYDSSGCAPHNTLLVNSSTPSGLSFKWELGNSSMVSTQADSITYIFTNSGITDTVWNIKLIAMAGAGCKDSVTKQILVHPDARPSFTIDTGYCAPFTLSPTNTTPSSPVVSKWKWYLRNAGNLRDSSVNQNPSFNFGDNQTGADSNYNLVLYITTADGCTDSIYKNFTVFSRPHVGFISDTVCQGNNTQFSDTSVLPTTSTSNIYKWYFGDGDSSTQISPAHFYSTGITYYTKLTITSSKGCIDTLTRPVIVYPRPVPVISLATAACSPVTISPSNTTSASPTVSVWNWSVRNSGVVTRNYIIKNPSIIFPDNQTGTDSIFYIHLIAVTNKGCVDSTSDTITIRTRPVASFGFDTAACGSVTRTASNASLYGSTYNWIVSPSTGITITTSTSSSPDISFPINNDSIGKLYTIRQRVTTSAGCRDSITDTFLVYPTPVAGFSVSQSDTCSPLTEKFTNTTTPYNNLTYNWNFGNGYQSSIRDTSIVYTNPGVNDSFYTILLTAENIYTCFDTQAVTIRIKPDAKSYFTATDSVGCAPYHIPSGKITASHFGNANSQYKWYINSTQTGSTQTGATLSFPGTSITNANDSFILSLIAISSKGCKNDTLKMKFRTIPNPTPRFSMSDTAGCHPFTVNFTDSSSPSGGLTYFWDFGNGQTSSTQHPSGIVFNNSGNTDSIYTIKLVVSAGTGCKDSVTHTLRVKPLPNPGFSSSKDTICFPQTITLTNSSGSSPTISSYLWKVNGSGTQISDTTSSTNTVLTVPDNQTGNYKNYIVTLTAGTGFGCIDSIKKQVSVATRPIASFVPDPDSSCGPKVFTITNTTQYGNTYKWSTTHLNISISNSVANEPTISIPENFGTADSIYIIRLISTTLHGCRDTAYNQVMVHPRPVAAYTADSIYSCGPSTVNFTNNGSGNTTLSHLWNFGDGGTSSAVNPTHIYYPSAYQDTTFSLLLISSTTYGCKDTVTGIIKVKPSPTATFDLSDTLICTYSGSPATITIFNNSIGNVDTFFWDFGDGQTAVSTVKNNFTHTYNNEGHYWVKLVTYNECNIARDSMQITVLEIPHVKFTRSDSVTCDSVITFTNKTSNSLQNGYISFLWNFGDGTNSTAVQPGVKNYPKNKSGKDSIYYISLTAFSRCDTITYIDSVKLRTIPFANFNPSKQTGCSPLTLAMHNQSLGVDSNSSLVYNYFVWNWGDSTQNDTTYSRSNFFHTYYTGRTDTFTIRMWAYNECGVDSEAHDVIVYPNSIVPFVSISPANGMGCNPLTVSFTNNTTGANTFLWNFDGVNTANTRHTSWTFNQADSYSVALTASNGCSDTTIYIPIIVTDPPIASFSDSGNYCQPAAIYFKNTTTSATSYTWYFGNGDSSIAMNPSYTFTGAGNYTVTLIARNVNQYGQTCVDTATRSITLYTKPTAVITVDTSKGCEIFKPQFSASSSSSSNNYAWNFGNGNTSTAISPFPSFATAGRDTTFTVRLVASNTAACSDTAYHTITVYAKTQANFNVSDTFNCFPAQIVFTNNSYMNASSALWRPDTGVSYTTFSGINYTYTKPGIYYPSLKVTTVWGCTDSITRKIKIGGNDSLKINTNDTQLCLGIKGTYHCSFSSPQFVKWDFGNGDTASGKTVQHVWNSAGTYTVIMTMTGPDGCIDSAIRSVTVFPLPNPGFSVNDTDQCVNAQNFIFTNSSVASAGISAYLWKWGDGSFSTQTSPNKTYSSYNNYSVTLIVTSNQGCIDSIKKMVYVYPKPNPSFSINDTDQCVNTNNFTFTNTTSIGYGSMTYNWDMGDGNTTTQTSPNYTYADTGIYRVHVTATSDRGCIDTISKLVYIRVIPNVYFVANDTQYCLNGNQFQFANASTITYGSMSYQWNFGDGNNSTQTSPSHSYSNYGNYLVKLKAVSDYGCIDSFIQPVIVWPKPNPVLSINDTNQCINGQNFIFTNNSNIAYGNMTYELDYGDGTRITFTSNPVSHTYSNAGSYPVTLLAVSDNYCLDSITRWVVVAPKPTVSFNINDTGQCVNNNTYIYTNTSSITSGLLNYLWDYGDGSTYNPAGPNYDGQRTYTSFNTYTVKLKSVSDLGCSDSAWHTVTVYPKPSPQFNINDSDQCLTGNSFSFVNQSNTSYGTLYYTWYAGDGTILTANSPTHSYTYTDTFHVQLLVLSDQGCRDSVSKPVYVRPMPVPDFLINDSDQCVNANTIYTYNNSQIGYGNLSYGWNFNDGFTSNQVAPSHVYTNTGTYTISVTATSDYGCVAGTSHDIYIRNKPAAAFSLSDSDNCVLLDQWFTNQGSNDIIQWAWNFGDPTSPDNTSNLASPRHIYYQPGIYYPQVIVSNQYGCFDTVSQRCMVYSDPVSAFTYSPKNACDTPVQVNFTNLSTGAVNYLWEFGNGKVSSQADPSMIYTNTGYYPVQLISFSQDGCRDTLIITYIVAAEPKASYLISDDTACMPVDIFFTNQTRNGKIYNWDFGDGQGSTDFEPLHRYTSAGNYTITLSVENGNCFDTVASSTIEVLQRPLAEFNWNFVGQQNAGIVQFNDATQYANQYFWNFDDGNTSTLKDPLHRYDLHGDYRVTLIASNDNQCYDTVMHPLHIELMKGLFVGNAFTPEDNTGDARLFKPQGIGLKEYHIRIFTTWGELIWESSELENTRPKLGWDGTKNGHPCKQDVYVWKIEAEFLDGSQWPGKKMPNGTYTNIGTVTLIR